MQDLSKSESDLQVRNLRAEERQLIGSLLSRVWTKEVLEKTLSTSLVKNMQDGGMGSIRFVHPEARSFGTALIEAKCTDSDGMLVSIALNVDNRGDLFELDFWKVDFSPLRRYPAPSDIRFPSSE